MQPYIDEERLDLYVIIKKKLDIFSLVYQNKYKLLTHYNL